MNRRSFLRRAVPVALTPILGRAVAADELRTRPNFVFILIDDLGWKRPGLHGKRLL